MVAVAASDLERLGSTISAANVAAAGSTTTMGRRFYRWNRRYRWCRRFGWSHGRRGRRWW
ncbi:PE family protein [Mycobacterium marinum]|nr:PE family protein [Mycobacterium marinum]MDC8997951.1 PE family protein [Mycobacterium marinum]MDC9008691.1 PE family protein [Mycobacterium marinum]